MTSRERVLAALDHRQPDRVPVDFGGHRSSGIMGIAYAKLKQALGIRSGDIYLYDVIQQLAIVEPPVLDALGVDCVELGRGFLLDDRDWRPWQLPDGTPCKVPVFVKLEQQDGAWYIRDDQGRALAVQKPGCLYFEQLYFPWLERDPAEDDFADLAAVFPHSMWTAVASPGGHLGSSPAAQAQLAAGARALRASTDRAIIGLFGGNLFEVPQFLYRNDTYLMHLAAEPEAMHRLAARLTDLHLANLERFLGAVGPYIDVIVFGDDLGGQNGPLISPEMYRTFFKAHHQRLWQRAKELAPVKVMLHSCGGIEPLLPDLIEAGLDAVNPVQISCRGMDAATLKQRYGGQLTFWGGGCDTRDVLPHASPADIGRHVRAQVALLNPGGGFVFQQVHNIMANVPPENIITMFAAINGR